jgi:hypothetical protein
MPDERFSMTVDQLLDGIQTQAFMARRSKGARRRAAFVRLLDLASTARDYVVLGFPEPTADDEIRRSSEEWTAIFGIRIADADGWDRSNFAASWAEPITLDEYKRRVRMSTHDMESYREAFGADDENRREES